MARHTLRHEVLLAAPVDVVFRHLADPQNYVGLSPLVIRVEDVATSRDVAGRRRARYIAVERFGRGILHWDNRIRVELTEAEPHQRLTSRVDSPGRVALDVTVELEPGERLGAPDTATPPTRMVETIELTMPAALRRFVIGQARAVQLYRAEELARRMAAAREG